MRGSGHPWRRGHSRFSCPYFRTDFPDAQGLDFIRVNHCPESLNLSDMPVSRVCGNFVGKLAESYCSFPSVRPIYSSANQLFAKLHYCIATNQGKSGKPSSLRNTLCLSFTLVIFSSRDSI